MIKTKSILAPTSEEDGTRICVMRSVRGFYKYDEYMKDLSPSQSLLKSYQNKKITWEQYEKLYNEEMKFKKQRIKELKDRSDKGETITLLCWEKTDECCHRRLLKELIEDFKYDIES